MQSFLLLINLHLVARTEEQYKMVLGRCYKGEKRACRRKKAGTGRREEN